MTQQISPADFMAMTDGPDFELDEHHAPAPPTGGDPVQLIASALERIVGVIERHEAATEAEQQTDTRVADLEAEVTEISDLHDQKQQLIEQTLEVIKKSTSKLAHEVRGILEPVVVPAPAGPQCPACRRYFADVELLERHECTAEHEPEDGEQGPPVPQPEQGPPVPQPEQSAEFARQPADDAPVERWRQFVRGTKSFLGVDVDALNKSQIRTLLGLAHPSEQVEG